MFLVYFTILTETAETLYEFSMNVYFTILTETAETLYEFAMNATAMGL